MIKKKIGLVLCIILFIYFIGGIIYNLSDTRVDINKDKVEKIGIQIKDFEYICLENDSDIYKKEFKELKINLESDAIDYRKYAESVSKLFIIDLYTLNNKKNMYDVGGTEFVYPDALENYKLNVENTLYKYMEDINNGKREQILPEVSNVETVDLQESEYVINEEKFGAYKLKLNIVYVSDLGYDKDTEVVLIKKDKYLYVVEKN